MSANLITGNLFKPIYAYQDADYQAGISGNVTSIMPVGSKMALSIEDANTIKADDGVLITKEGRRIQIDAGAIEEWSIPTGTQGQTNYYIVGFRLYTGDDSSELCETFVEQMENATDTIPENTFRSGATEVYISLGRVVQSGINLDSVTSFLPTAQSFEDIKNAIISLNNRLNGKTDKTTIHEYTSTPSNLAQFVQRTATGSMMVSFRFNDVNNVLGFGASQWIKGYIQYQNAYGGTYDVNGMGIVSIQGGNLIFIKVTGTGTSFTVTRRDLTDGTTYNAGSCPDNTTFGTNGSIKRVYDSYNRVTKLYGLAGPIGTGNFNMTNSSGYRYILVCEYDGTSSTSQLIDSLLIPRAVWTTSHYLKLGRDSYYISLRRISDTACHVVGSNSAYIEIYGLM